MKNSTLNTWKYLQDNSYFENHAHYGEFVMVIPQTVNLKDITNKVVVEIGCGYGRETVYLAQNAKYVYGIEVNQTIKEKAEQHLTKYNLKNSEIILTEEYKEKIPNNIDYVYALHVFQHLSPEQTKEYIDIMYDKLRDNGKMHIQFYLGSDQYMPEKEEPRVQYTELEVLDLFKKFKLEQLLLQKQYSAKEQKLLFEHLYITARK